MRARYFILGGALLVGWLAGCSPRDRAGTAPAQRDIRLAAPAQSGVEAPTVSNLEAGRVVSHVPVSPPPVRQRPVAMREHSGGASAVLEQAFEPVAPALAPASQAAQTISAAPEVLPEAAAAAGPSAADAGSGSGESSGRVDPYHQPVFPRSPGILIRGGMGGVDDKCDLHRRGRSGGIAINRMAPSLYRGGIH